MKPHLSIVVPAFNEERRLEQTLLRLQDYCEEQTYPAEIIVVDDGSADGTADLALKIASERHGIRLLKNGQNRGKGYSVRRGMLEAQGEYRLFSDADLSAPIEEVEKLLPLFDSGYDIVIGSRSAAGANVVAHQPVFRELMGRVFNRLVRGLLLPGIIDTQCGFKCFRASAAEAVFSRQTLDGFSFDVEILYIGSRLSHRIKEVPITWSHCADTKVNLIADPVKMFQDLLRIRIRHRHLLSNQNGKG